jgi:hypothetical protein
MSFSSQTPSSYRSVPEVHFQGQCSRMPRNREQHYARPRFDDSRSLFETYRIENRFASQWKNLGWFCLIFVTTFTWIAVVFCYAFLSSFSSIPTPLFQTPARAVFALNLGSTIAIVLLSALINEACDILRWRLATGSNGIGIATFLALGRGTTMMGVIRLLFSGQKIGHQKWCIQRFHMIK